MCQPPETGGESTISDQTRPLSTATLLNRAGLVRHEAERLLCRATGANRATVVGGVAVTEEQEALFYEMCARRRQGEPLQYLEGSVAFGPIEVAVDRRVLVPRPETEQLWELAMTRLPTRPGLVVDLGTGSGCLALAVKFQRPEMRVVATDIDPGALTLARRNVGRLGLEVECLAGDMLDALPAQLQASVDLLIANPPYLSESEWDGLSPEVRDFEPRRALVGGSDGLHFYRRLAEEAGPWLAPAGWLVAEIGQSQAAALTDRFGSAGWRTDIHPDLTGRPRFLTARWHS